MGLNGRDGLEFENFDKNWLKKDMLCIHEYILAAAIKYNNKALIKKATAEYSTCKKKKAFLKTIKLLKL